MPLVLDNVVSKTWVERCETHTGEYCGDPKYEGGDLPFGYNEAVLWRAGATRSWSCFRCRHMIRSLCSNFRHIPNTRKEALLSKLLIKPNHARDQFLHDIFFKNLTILDYIVFIVIRQYDPAKVYIMLRKPIPSRSLSHFNKHTCTYNTLQ